MSQQNVSSSGFEGVKVSKGFVRGLQGQVFKLERNMQGLITQLEHANALATEFHETSVIYQRKYDDALRQIEEMRREHGYEKAILNYNLEAANEEAANEREQNEARSEQIKQLEQELANQCDIAQMQQSWATTTIMDMDADMEADMGRGGGGYREELSPVSISCPSPRTPTTPMARRGQTPTLDPETPEPATPTQNSFRFQYQCSPAMASYDGLYEQRVVSEPTRDEHDEHTDDVDDVDWEQKEREDWTESIRSKLRR